MSLLQNWHNVTWVQQKRLFSNTLISVEGLKLLNACQGPENTTYFSLTINLAYTLAYKKIKTSLVYLLVNCNRKGKYMNKLS